MAKEESHRLTPTQLADRVWAIAENIRFCLYTSVKGGKLQQWPLTATAERDERAFYFLVSQKGGKYSNLRRAPEASRTRSIVAPALRAHTHSWECVVVPPHEKAADQVFPEFSAKAFS